MYNPYVPCVTTTVPLDLTSTMEFCGRLSDSNNTKDLQYREISTTFSTPMFGTPPQSFMFGNQSNYNMSFINSNGYAAEQTGEVSIKDMLKNAGINALGNVFSAFNLTGGVSTQNGNNIGINGLYRNGNYDNYYGYSNYLMNGLTMPLGYPFVCNSNSVNEVSIKNMFKDAGINGLGNVFSAFNLTGGVSTQNGNNIGINGVYRY